MKLPKIYLVAMTMYMSSEERNVFNASTLITFFENFFQNAVSFPGIYVPLSLMPMPSGLLPNHEGVRNDPDGREIGRREDERGHVAHLGRPTYRCS